MTELEKSKAIIKYIADSKKITPVKLYTKSEIKNSYDCKVFGEGKFKVIIGDWESVQKIIDENNIKNIFFIKNTSLFSQFFYYLCFRCCFLIYIFYYSGRHSSYYHS